MSDPNEVISQTVVTAGDTAITTAQTLVDAFVTSRAPGLTAIVIPLAAEGAKELETLLAEYVPKWLAAAEHEVETLWGELVGKLKSLFQKHAPQPLVPVGSPLDKLTDAELALMYSSLYGSVPLDVGQVVDGWTAQSLIENKAGISWLMQHRGLIK